MANMIITHVLYNIHIYSRIHRDKWNTYRRFILVWCLKYLVLEPKALTRSCHPSQHEDYAKFEKPHLKARSRTDFDCPKSNRNQWSNDSQICLWTAHDNGEFTPRPEQQQHDHQRCHAHPNPPNRCRNHQKSRHTARRMWSKKQKITISSIFINFLKSWTNPNDRSTPFTQNLTSPTEFYKAFPFPCHSPLARCQWQGLPCLHTGAVRIITKDFEQLLCTAFEADSRHLTISPASKKSRPQWNMGKVENISDLRFLILLLTLFILLLQGQKNRESEWQHRKTSSTDGTQHQIVQQLYILHVSFLDLFCTTKSRWPQLAAALGQGGIAPPRLRNPNFEPKNRHRWRGIKQHARRIDKVVTFLQQQKITNLHYIFFVYSLYHIKSYPSIWSICFSELSWPKSLPLKSSAFRWNGMFATWERDFLVSFSSWSIDWTYLGKKATKWRCCNSVYSIYSCLFSIPYILCPFTPILTSSHPHTSCREMSPALSRCARYLRAFQVSNFASFSSQPEVSEIPEFVVVTLQSRSLLSTSKMSQHQTPKKNLEVKKNIH